MRVLALALVYLGSVSFLAAEAARLDIASDFKRKWSRWALGRVRREATLAKSEANAPSSLIKVREVQGEPSRREEEGHIRLKRQDPNIFFHTHLRVSCKMGTCSVAKLADQLFHLNNKDKDPNAPVRKISPHGYGRRRRSLWDLVDDGSNSDRKDSKLLSRRLASSSFLSQP